MNSLSDIAAAGQGRDAGEAARGRQRLQAATRAAAAAGGSPSPGRAGLGWAGLGQAGPGPGGGWGGWGRWRMGPGGGWASSSRPARGRQGASSGLLARGASASGLQPSPPGPLPTPPLHPRGSGNGGGGGRRGAHAQHPAPPRARRYRAGGRDEGGSGTAHAHCIPEASPRPRRPGGCHGNGACAAPQQPRALGREMEARAALRLPHPTPAALLSPGARVLGSSIPAARGAACLSVCAHPTERLLQHASSSMPQALKHCVNNYHNTSKT